MAKPLTLREQVAELTALVASLTSAPVAPAAAASHWKARDLTCTRPVPCTKTFRTVKGQAFHAANAIGH